MHQRWMKIEVGLVLRVYIEEELCKALEVIHYARNVNVTIE